MSQPARIRRAGAADAEDLAALHNDTWGEAYSGIIPAETIERVAQRRSAQWAQVLADPDAPAVWVAQRAGAGLVGFATATAAGTGQVRPLELTSIYVRSGEHGTGTAQHLLQITIGDAPCSLWVAQANPRAIAFYGKNGFTADGATQQPEWLGGTTIIRMVR